MTRGGLNFAQKRALLRLSDVASCPYFAVLAWAQMMSEPYLYGADDGPIEIGMLFDSSARTNTKSMSRLFHVFISWSANSPRVRLSAAITDYEPRPDL